VRLPNLRFPGDEDLARARLSCGTLADCGALVHPRHNWFVSAAHTDEDVTRVLVQRIVGSWRERAGQRATDASARFWPALPLAGPAPGRGPAPSLRNHPASQQTHPSGIIREHPGSRECKGDYSAGKTPGSPDPPGNPGRFGEG